MTAGARALPALWLATAAAACLTAWAQGAVAQAAAPVTHYVLDQAKSTLEFSFTQAGALGLVLRAADPGVDEEADEFEPRRDREGDEMLPLRFDRQAGVGLLVGPGKIAGASGVDAAGAVMLMVATLSWAAGSLYSRRARLPASQLLATAMEVVVTLAGCMDGT